MQASSFPPTFSLSVVSHGQLPLIVPLLADLSRLRFRNFEVLITLNIPEDAAAIGHRDFPLTVISNAEPKGFGANHNAAFARSRGSLFVVVNPDIRTPALDMQILASAFDNPRIGACAPKVLSTEGRVEDSARRFPTIASLFRRVLLDKKEPDYAFDNSPMLVDWVAGMFVVFRREAFSQARGFDAGRYFMYFEDVDICARLRRLGWEVRLQPATSVVHDAQRASHRDLRHLRWHVTSALRYLTGL
jgi:N-acetylglucosaminyl-diphospho-decaprenol L-rhamnosyltransferase